MQSIHLLEDIHIRSKSLNCFKILKYAKLFLNEQYAKDHDCWIKVAWHIQNSGKCAKTPKFILLNIQKVIFDDEE